MSSDHDEQVITYELRVSLEQLDRAADPGGMLMKIVDTALAEIASTAAGKSDGYAADQGPELSIICRQYMRATREPT